MLRKYVQEENKTNLIKDCDSFFFLSEVVVKTFLGNVPGVKRKQIKKYRTQIQQQEEINHFEINFNSKKTCNSEFKNSNDLFQIVYPAALPFLTNKWSLKNLLLYPTIPIIKLFCQNTRRNHLTFQKSTFFKTDLKKIQVFVNL